VLAFSYVLFNISRITLQKNVVYCSM